MMMITKTSNKNCD